MKAVLDSVEADHWIDAIASLNDDQLSEFLSALTGRSVRAIKRRLCLAGMLAAFLDFGHRSKEMERMYEEVYPHGR